MRQAWCGWRHPGPPHGVTQQSGQARRGRDRLWHFPCCSSNLSKVATVGSAATVLRMQSGLDRILEFGVGEKHHESATPGAGDAGAVRARFESGAIQALDTFVADLRSHALFGIPAIAQNIVKPA